MLGALQPWKKPTTAAPPASPPAPLAPYDRLAEARERIDAGRLEAARELLRAEIQENPRSARAHALLALAQIRAGDPSAAQTLLGRAAEYDPDLFEIPLFQGHLDMTSGDHASARRSYTEALRRRPGNAQAFAGRAAARVELREHAGAIEDATAALAADPTEHDALFTRAAAYGALGKWEDSIRDWTAYLGRRPGDAQAWKNRGNANRRLGRASAAVADWKQAVKLDASLGEQLNPLINEAEQ